MMTTLNRILPVFMALTVSVFFMACEGDDRNMEDTELGTGTEGLEQTPTQPAPRTGNGTFASWDTDTNSDLSEDEFGTGVNQGTWWTEWDSDTNSTLNQEEFDTSFGEYQWYESGLFGEWDADGNGELTEQEWESGLFGTWDENSDNRIQENEYDEGLFGGSM